MSKDLFLDHRIREIEKFDTWTKQETLNKGKQLAIDITDKGEIQLEEALAKLQRFSDLISNAIKELKPNIEIDKPITVNGVKLTYVNGGKIYDFGKDATWQHYQSKIDEAKAMQKLREKQLIKATESEDTILSDDEVVEGVPLKGYRKSYIKVTY